jgi:hypothetical protein
MERTVAVKVMRELMEFSAPVNALTALSNELGMTEGREMRKGLAAIMMAVDEMMRPVIRECPDLDPDRNSD